MVAKRSFDAACSSREPDDCVELSAEKKCRSATSVIVAIPFDAPSAAPRDDAPPASRRLVFARRRPPAASSPCERAAPSDVSDLGARAGAHLAAASPPSVVDINDLLLWRHGASAARHGACAPRPEHDDEWGQFVSF